MRRSTVSVVATLLAFLAGVGVNRLIWARPEQSTPPVPQVKAVPNIAPVAEPVVPVEPLREGKIILDYNSEKFSPEGSYYLIGQTPKEFAEFDGFSIEYYEDKGVGAGRIFLVTNVGETYETVPAIFGFVTERRVVFLTSPHLKTEFEYRFDGEFIRGDFDPATGTVTPVLRGTLTKTKHDRKVAERVIRLRVEHHGC